MPCKLVPSVSPCQEPLSFILKRKHGYRLLPWEALPLSSQAPCHTSILEEVVWKNDIPRSTDMRTHWRGESQRSSHQEVPRRHPLIETTFSFLPCFFLDLRFQCHSFQLEPRLPASSWCILESQLKKSPHAGFAGPASSPRFPLPCAQHPCTSCCTQTYTSYTWVSSVETGTEVVPKLLKHNK